MLAFTRVPPKNPEADHISQLNDTILVKILLISFVMARSAHNYNIKKMHHLYYYNVRKYTSQPSNLLPDSNRHANQLNKMTNMFIFKGLLSNLRSKAPVLTSTQNNINVTIVS